MQPWKWPRQFTSHTRDTISGYLGQIVWGGGGGGGCSHTPPRGVIPGGLSYTLHNTLGVLYLNMQMSTPKGVTQHLNFNSV